MRFRILSFPCIAAVLSASIQAEPIDEPIDSLEPITVSADKRPENLYDVPMSVGVVTGETSRNLTLRQLEDVSRYIPNMHLSQNGSQFSRLFIRGIGSGLNLGFEQSVGAFRDGIYSGRDRQSRFPLLDIERVEVLKGPQGIVFGKNTTAGAINVVSAKPQHEFGSRLATFYAPHHGEAFSEGMLTGAIAEGLAGRIAGRISHLDGYLINTALNRREPENDEQLIRGSLSLDRFDNFDVDAKYEYGHFKVRGLSSQMIETGRLPSQVFRLFDPQFESNFDRQRSVGNTGYLFGPDLSNTSYHQGAIFAHSQIGDHELSATTAYNQYQYRDLFDLDFSPLSLVGQQTNEKFQQFSQEIRVDSPKASTASWQPWNRDALEYLFGAYYQYQDLAIDTTANVNLRQLSRLGIPFGGLGVVPAGLDQLSRVNHSAQKSHIGSAFGRASWQPIEDWKLTAGLRFSYELKDATKSLFIADLGTRNPNPVLAEVARIATNTRPHEFRGSREEKHLMPMAGIEWNIVDRHLAYFNFSTSSKSGGFDDLAASGIQKEWQFSDELALSYELGVKTRWLDDKLNLNISLFRSDFKGFQVSQFDGRANFVVGNAASVRSQGIEVDGRFKITEDLDLAGAIAWLDARYVSFSNASCTAMQAISSGNLSACRQDLSGRTSPYAPDWSGNVFMEHRLPLNRLRLDKGWINELAITTQINVSFRDSYFLAEDLDPLLVQNAFAMLDLRFALGDRSEHWEIAFVGKNLTNELISLEGNDVPLLAGALRKSTARPRSFGVQMVLAY